MFRRRDQGFRDEGIFASRWRPLFFSFSLLHEVMDAQASLWQHVTVLAETLRRAECLADETRRHAKEFFFSSTWKLKLAVEMTGCASGLMDYQRFLELMVLVLRNVLSSPSIFRWSFRVRANGLFQSGQLIEMWMNFQSRPGHPVGVNSPGVESTARLSHQGLGSLGCSLISCLVPLGCSRQKEWS